MLVLYPGGDYGCWAYILYNLFICKMIINPIKILQVAVCKKSFKQRREILSKIPEGVNCYEWKSFATGRGGYTMASGHSQCVCPYWKSLSNTRAKCTLYNIKDKHPQDPGTLLWDQVKLCGLKT